MMSQAGLEVNQEGKLRLLQNRVQPDPITLYLARLSRPSWVPSQLFRLENIVLLDFSTEKYRLAVFQDTTQSIIIATSSAKSQASLT